MPSLLLMTGRTRSRLQFFSIVDLSKENCNHHWPPPVTSHGVERTWMNRMRAHWSKLRSRIMTTQLARSCVSFIRLSQKWCVPIDRDELLKRIFAK